MTMVAWRTDVAQACLVAYNKGGSFLLKKEILVSVAFCHEPAVWLLACWPCLVQGTRADSPDLVMSCCGRIHTVYFSGENCPYRMQLVLSLLLQEVELPAVPLPGCSTSW